MQDRRAKPHVKTALVQSACSKQTKLQKDLIMILSITATTDHRTRRL
jgi:hypothetical protein